MYEKSDMAISEEISISLIIILPQAASAQPKAINIRPR